MHDWIAVLLFPILIVVRFIRILVMSRDFTCGEKKINNINMKLVFITYLSKLKTYMSQIKHFTADRNNPCTQPLADLEYILKFARNATWWLIEVAPLR
jgi:hypothetical protein